MSGKKPKKRGRKPLPQTDGAGPFARELRRCREARGWTQEQLAQACRSDDSGVSARSIAYYETGRDPLLSAAVRLSQVLDFSLDAVKEKILQKSSECT